MVTKPHEVQPTCCFIGRDSPRERLSSYLVVMVPEADADGAAHPGEDSCHGVEVDQHVRHSLQDELFVDNGLMTSENENTLQLLISSKFSLNGNFTFKDKQPFF